jgi:quercetin dioxygenase-like cupin family protein
MTEAEFRAELASHGVAPYIAEWQPGRFNAEHAHDFTARGYVLAGGFTLTYDGVAHSQPAGSDFKLAAGIPHTELAGSEGATIIAGRLPAA